MDDQNIIMRKKLLMVNDDRFCKVCEEICVFINAGHLHKYLEHLSHNINLLISRVDTIEPLVIDKKRLILNIDELWNKIARIEKEIVEKDGKK